MPRTLPSHYIHVDGRLLMWTTGLWQSAKQVGSWLSVIIRNPPCQSSQERVNQKGSVRLSSLSAFPQGFKVDCYCNGFRKIAIINWILQFTVATVPVVLQPVERVCPCGLSATDVLPKWNVTASVCVMQPEDAWLFRNLPLHSSALLPKKTFLSSVRHNDSAQQNDCTFWSYVTSINCRQ